MATFTCPRCRQNLGDTRDPPLHCDHCGHALTPTVDESFPPLPERETPLDSLGGYRLLRRLGAGGMGSVWEAEEPATGRRVAVKLMASAFVSSPEALDRFRREGRLAARISHPRCVFVLAADEDAGRPYLVLELMPGDTLADLVARSGPLPLGRAVELTLDLLDGLEAVHDLGLVHRDVKPSNGFLDRDGRAKLGDFGLARSLAVGDALTRPGSFVGTPWFAAPEQLKGEPVDGRADVYSLAATLYYLLSGRPPHAGTDLAAVAARVASEPAPPVRSHRPDLPAALDRTLRRGLERDRDRRFPTVDAFRRALLRFAPPRPLTAPGLLRRALGGIGDFVVVMVLGSLLGELARPWIVATFHSYEGGILGRTSQPFQALVALLYFGPAEGLWGISPGKWLAGLRVRRATEPRPPGVARAALRVIIFFSLFWIPFLVLDPLPLDCVTRLLVGILLSTQAGGAALALSTMRARNGYRGPHEFVSGTRVVQRPPLPRKRILTTDKRRVLPLTADDPETVGPFRLRGRLAAQVYDAEDPALERAVVVCLRPPGAASPSAVRRDLNRPTRPRWLAGGDGPTRRWDAFSAPAGVSLAQRLATSGPLTWTEARPLLAALADEADAATTDCPLPEVVDLDLLFVAADSRPCLLDVPGIEGTPASGAPLVSEVAAQVLRGRPRPPPVHAAEALARLRGDGTPAERLLRFRADLEATRDRPTEMTRWHRAAHLLVQAALCLLVVAAALVLGNFLPATDYWPRTLVTSLLGLAVVAVAAGLRGGPSFALAGLALVRGDGRRAARWQAALRSVLVGVQAYFLLLLLFVALIFGRGTLRTPFGSYEISEEKWWCLPTALAWVVFVAWLPRRTWHDRAVGTHVVPE